MKRYILIGSPELIGDRVVSFKLTCSSDIEKYFLSTNLTAEYDEDMDELPQGIIEIPAVASVILLGWHLAADIHIEYLDRNYIESLGKVQNIFKSWYPKLPFSKLNVKNPIKNSSKGNSYGMLFSGGLDSMTTYLRNKQYEPRLFHCITRDEYLKTDKRVLREFAERERRKIHFIKSNINSIIHEKLLSSKFGVDWWGNISHSIVYTGLVAPFATLYGINTLLIASSHTKEFKHPWGSHPLIDNEITWAGTKVIHDGYELSRQQKIRFISNECKNKNIYEILGSLSIVPDRCPNRSNPNSSICGKCITCAEGKAEKCLRTIVGLTLEGIDCNKCGFNANKATFEFIRKCLVNGCLFKKKLVNNQRGQIIEEDSILFFWKDIQKYIAEGTPDDLYGSKEFFEWLKKFETDEYISEIKFHEIPRLTLATAAFYAYPFYCNIPYSVRNFSILKSIEDEIYKYIS